MSERVLLEFPDPLPGESDAAYLSRVLASRPYSFGEVPAFGMLPSPGLYSGMNLKINITKSGVWSPQTCIARVKMNDDKSATNLLMPPPSTYPPGGVHGVAWSQHPPSDSLTSWWLADGSDDEPALMTAIPTYYCYWGPVPRTKWIGLMSQRVFGVERGPVDFQILIDGVVKVDVVGEVWTGNLQWKWYPLSW